MSTDSMDRRVRKTRRQLRECLISLLKEKKVQDITVRELTDMADLNRGTFYLHYKDVFDLLEKTEAELQDEFNQLVLKHDAVDLKQRPAVIFNEIYSLVYENADLIEILLGENGDLNFVNRLKKLIREKCLKDWMEVFRTGNPAVFDAFFSYIASGCVGLVQYWLQTGLKETPQQMAKLTEQIITQGIEVLEMDPYA
ncbi:TetR/AcrR family transcriptional regulator [Enterocloster citroniae]|uniref:TetR/AcrR family transcriptional regulator n=1 Tax=Enterocloster citroniae TaxID=358743 RepID=UPI00349E6636